MIRPTTCSDNTNAGRNPATFPSPKVDAAGSSGGSRRWLSVPSNAGKQQQNVCTQESAHETPRCQDVATHPTAHSNGDRLFPTTGRVQQISPEQMWRVPASSPI